jgi:hypothetical protein
MFVVQGLAGCHPSRLLREKLGSTCTVTVVHCCSDSTSVTLIMHAGLNAGAYLYNKGHKQQEEEEVSEGKTPHSASLTHCSLYYLSPSHSDTHSLCLSLLLPPIRQCHNNVLSMAHALPPTWHGCL